MNTSQCFFVTAECQVYSRAGGILIRLGHIAGILTEDTAIARQVREWWHARLASDTPTENLVIVRGGEPPIVFASDARLVVAWWPSTAWANTIAAD